MPFREEGGRKRNAGFRSVTLILHPPVLLFTTCAGTRGRCLFLLFLLCRGFFVLFALFPGVEAGRRGLAGEGEAPLVRAGGEPAPEKGGWEGACSSRTCLDPGRILGCRRQNCLVCGKILSLQQSKLPGLRQNFGLAAVKTDWSEANFWACSTQTCPWSEAKFGRG